MKRRHFIKNATLSGAGLAIGNHLVACSNSPSKTQNKDKIMTHNTTPSPIAICTWAFAKANAKAGAELIKGTKALDAAIAGVAVEEENLKNTTVGKGGAPDREGNVTLDACVMDSTGDCGAVL